VLDNNGRKKMTSIQEIEKLALSSLSNDIQQVRTELIAACLIACAIDRQTAMLERILRRLGPSAGSAGGGGGLVDLQR
jgi:hypothetical protein